MGCFSLLNIYEPKSIGVFIKFQPIMQLMDFFISDSLGNQFWGPWFKFILQRLYAASESEGTHGLEHCRFCSRLADFARGQGGELLPPT
jgi:hypothetical protein